jgi:hypothetical protein
MAQVHASESQHWYARDGSPAYEVKGANGNMRPATLRDARKLGLVPSVTTIIGSCAKPGLERWKLEQMMHAALTLPRLDREPEADWISRVWTDSKETARKAAERGTAIHAAIQGWYEGEDYMGTPFEKHVEAADVAVDQWLGEIWTAEQSFAHELGFGGKVDLSSQQGVIDFKTKEFSEVIDLRTWDEHAMQLAAYRVGLRVPQARCAICYVSVTVPGLVKVIEIKEPELAKGWQMFKGLLAYWKAKSSFDPSWSEEVVTERATAEAQA